MPLLDLFFSARKSDHVSPLLREVHRLFRSRSGSDYAFWCTAASTAPRRHDISRRQPPSNRRRRLRSFVSDTFVVAPTNRSTLGDHALPVAASRAWNGLPSSVRAASSLSTFRLVFSNLSRPVAHLSRLFWHCNHCVYCILVDTVQYFCNVSFVTASL